MNFRLTLALAIVLLIVGAAVLYTQRNGPAIKTTSTEPEHLLLSKQPKSVDAVTLSRDNKTIAAFQKTDDKWALTEPIKAPVERYDIDDVANALRSLTYRDKFSPEPSGNKSLEYTGVEPASAIVKFTDDTKAEHTLALGKVTPVGTRYVRIDKDPDIYEIDAKWFDKLDKDPSEFRSKDILSIAVERVAAITLQRSDQMIQINKNDGKWTIVKPITTRANAATADDMAGAVTNLHVESFTDTNYASAGLTPPVLTVTLQARDTAASAAPTTQPQQIKTTPTTIQFGNYADLAKKTIYASISGSSEVYVLSSDVFKKFDKPLFNLRDAAITPTPVDEATGIDISSALSSADSTKLAKLVLTRQDGNWTLQSPALPVDSSAATGILTAIKNLRANKFVDSPGDLKSIGLDPPEKTITLTLPGQTQRETILIGHPQKEAPLTPVQRQGEPTVFLVQTPDLALLSPSLLTLRDKTVANNNMTADSIQSIAITGPANAAPLKFEHAGANWTVNGKKADLPKIFNLLNGLTSLTVQRWIALTPPTGVPDLQVDMTINETTATKPTTLPAAQASGPQPLHLTHQMLLLYRTKATTVGGSPTWSATFAPPIGTTAAWTFEPTAALLDLLTKTNYEVPPTTAPAIAPATAPATNP